MNVRNRNRLIAEVAAALDISVPLVEDVHAPRSCSMAQPVAHTFIHGLYMYTDKSVGIANECIPTCFVNNGIVCKLSPWEGVFVFHGPHAGYTNGFGTAFGGDMNVFPVTSVRLRPRTAQIARRMHYFVQTLCPTDVSYWSDYSCDGKHDAPPAASANNDTDDGDGGDGSGPYHDPPSAAGAAHVNGLGGVGDPDLREIAQAACRRATRDAMAPSARASEARGAPNAASYISFDDSVVMSKMQNVQWDQRYGILRLIPLCVMTNGLV